MLLCLASHFAFKGWKDELISRSIIYLAVMTPVTFVYKHRASTEDYLWRGSELRFFFAWNIWNPLVFKGFWAENAMEHTSLSSFWWRPLEFRLSRPNGLLYETTVRLARAEAGGSLWLRLLVNPLSAVQQVLLSGSSFLVFIIIILRCTVYTSYGCL